MHIMALIDKFQDGDMTFDGESVKGMSNKQLAEYRNNRIGLVLQDFALIPEYTVMENVLLPAMFTRCNMRIMRKRAEELIERTGLSDHLTHFAAQLSGGQKQRVAVCRALINDPELILADEPTGALDTANSSDIISLLKEIRDENKSLVVITHDLEIAQGFERRFQLKDGVLNAL